MAAALGLAFLAGCVGLIGVLTVRGAPDAGSVTQLLGIVLAVLALAIPLLTWWLRGGVVPAPTAGQLDDARATLAGAVKGQWRQEAVARSLGNPEPMPVCWELTEPALMDRPPRIAVEESPFTGRSDDISQLAAEFRRLRRRRLVLLGGPGSGKTTLAVQLLLELLASRGPREPIPVLVSLAGWDPTEHSQLHTWLAARLAEDYPALRAFGPTTADALAQQGHLLPVLDGLDELPEHRQSRVIRALNESLTDTDQLILTSRTAEYTAAIKEAGNVLSSAAVIEPKPLTTAQAAEYLTGCLPPDPGDAWAEFLRRLRADEAGHLAPLVETPLGLWLLRTVYIERQADPTPLLTSDTSPGDTPVRAHLFDQLIPAVLTHRPAASRHHVGIFRPRRRWNPDDVQRWLTFLAQHLHRTDTKDLHWWHLARHTLTPSAVKLAIGGVLGLTFGLVIALTYGVVINPAVGLAGGAAFGLTFGLIFGLMVGPTAQRWLADEPAYANLRLKHRVMLLIRRLVVGMVVGMVVGLAVGLVLGLTFGLALDLILGLRLMLALAAGLAVGLTGGLVIGLITWVGIPSRTDWASGPQSTYQASRTLTVLQLCLALLTIVLVVGLTGWVAAGLTGRVAAGLTGGAAAGLTDILQPKLINKPTTGLAVGLVCGSAAGLAGGFAARRAGQLVIRSGAWLCYVLAIWRLAIAGKLPLRLMGFLDDAHRLGLLRTFGPAYQFRHAEFQDHLVRPRT